MENNTILNIKYHNETKDNILKEVFLRIESNKKASVCFLNADCFYKAHKDTEYKSILNSTEFVLSDGTGLKLVTVFFGSRMKEDCNGTDFSPLLMQKAAGEEYKIFFSEQKTELPKKQQKI